MLIVKAIISEAHMLKAKTTLKKLNKISSSTQYDIGINMHKPKLAEA